MLQHTHHGHEFQRRVAREPPYRRHLRGIFVAGAVCCVARGPPSGQRVDYAGCDGRGDEHDDQCPPRRRTPRRRRRPSDRRGLC